jgi:hypothetical protein
MPCQKRERFGEERSDQKNQRISSVNSLLQKFHHDGALGSRVEIPTAIVGSLKGIEKNVSTAGQPMTAVGDSNLTESGKSAKHGQNRVTRLSHWGAVT